MELQPKINCHQNKWGGSFFMPLLSSSSSSTPFNLSNPTTFIRFHRQIAGIKIDPIRTHVKRRCRGVVLASGKVGSAEQFWDAWKPVKGYSAPSLSDVVWPSAGAFLAMAILGKIDQILAPKGISITIASLGAVSAVLFAAPSSPAARKYNMFMSQVGCAALGVVALSLFAASLPILFIDVAKLHRLNFWYAVFPGATGCILLCLIQEIVSYLKENFNYVKFSSVVMKVDSVSAA
ncbi:hypothetical protein RJ641_009283, partial [Dillenia turbinata]